MYSDLQFKAHDKVAEALGHYVYVYVDPRCETIKYVGKGVGTRVLDHLGDQSESEKAQWIKELKEQGLEPRIDIIAHSLKTEDEALLVERCLIDAIGMPPLTNKMRGHDTEFGREPLKELIIEHQATPVEILSSHKVIIFRLNKYFKEGMSEQEIYEGTRGSWKVNKSNAEQAEYIFGVQGGVVRGVYVPEEWLPAGTTPYEFREIHPSTDTDKPRWEFTGERAPPEIQKMYLHKSVKSYLKSQNPVGYINILK